MIVFIVLLVIILVILARCIRVVQLVQGLCDRASGCFLYGVGRGPAL